MKGQLSIELLISFMVLISFITIFLGAQNASNSKIALELNQTLDLVNKDKWESQCFLNSMDGGSLKLFWPLQKPQNSSCLDLQGGKRWFQS